MLLKTFFFAGLFFCLGSAKEVNILFAQLKSLSFERLSIENGLSSNIINGMIQDRQGFYWFATVDGLNRFDGTSVKIFRHNKNDTTSISHNNCNAVVESADGDIWVATMRGVCRYQKKTGVFRRYFFHHPHVNDDVLNRTQKLVKDNEGNIWAKSYGIWKIDPAKNSLRYLFEDYDSIAVPEGPLAHDIYFDHINKGLWFNTPHHLNFFDIATKKIYHPGNNPKGWTIFQKQNKRPLFVIDNTGKVWWVDDSRKHLKWFVPASASGGTVEPGFSQDVTDLSVAGDKLLLAIYKSPALLYNLRTNQIDTMPQPGFSNASLLSRIASHIYLDRNNNTWFRTAEGAYISPEVQKGIKTYSLGKDASGYPYSINSIVNGRQILWLTISSRLYQYNYVEQKLKPVVIKNFAYPVNYVLYNAGDSVLWISSGENIVRVNQKNNRILSVTKLKGYPYFIVCNNRKKFWTGTWDEGLYELDEKGEILRHYTTKDGMPYNKLISCYYDGKNELWLGMNGGKGFTRLDMETKNWGNYLITGKEGVIESNTINAIVKDTAGNLWLGTYGGGAYYFDRKKELFRNYRQSDGLSGDYINTLVLDSTGNLWISTSNGMDFIDAQSKSIFRINTQGQLYTDHTNNLAKSREGTFYYAVGDKIIAINPAQYIQSVSEATILISNFKIFDNEMPQLASPSPIKLSHRQNFFTVEYSALKVSPDILAQYAYKLDGLDKDWNYVGNRGVANYTNVPPGTYRLLLNATNETGKWNNNPVSLTITIVPPFWKTWWFYILSGLLISSIVIFSVRTRLNRIKKKQQDQLRLIVATQEKEKKNISAALHDDLGVRLSALKYFVASLKNHLLPNNPQANETYNKTLAVIDESVEDIRYMLISLSPKTLQEYGYITAVEDLINKLSHLHIIHINLKQKGMEKRLHPDVEAGLYRITQELINNALKHAEAGSISLNIEKANGIIQLLYTDDGKGFDLSKSRQGYGLENIHARVALLNGKIEWQTAVKQSTNVLISIPYNHT